MNRTSEQQKAKTLGIVRRKLMYSYSRICVELCFRRIERKTFCRPAAVRLLKDPSLFF